MGPLDFKAVCRHVAVSEIWELFRFSVFCLHLICRIISFFFLKYPLRKSNLVYFQENWIGRAFIYVNLKKLYILGKRYETGTKSVKLFYISSNFQYQTVSWLLDKFIRGLVLLLWKISCTFSLFRNININVLMPIGIPPPVS